MVARSSRVARSTPGIPPLAVGCVFVRGLLSHGEDESHLATKNCTLPIGLFNALVIFAREGERQRGLRGNSPLCSGNGAIVQLTYYAGSDAGRRPALPGVHTRLLRVRGGRESIGSHLWRPSPLTPCVPHLQTVRLCSPQPRSRAEMRNVEDRAPGRMRAGGLRSQVSPPLMLVIVSVDNV